MGGRLTAMSDCSSDSEIRCQGVVRVGKLSQGSLGELWFLRYGADDWNLHLYTAAELRDNTLDHDTRLSFCLCDTFKEVCLYICNVSYKKKRQFK